MIVTEEELAVLRRASWKMHNDGLIEEANVVSARHAWEHPL